MPHWVGVASSPRSEPKKWRSNSCSGRLRQVLEDDRDLAGLRDRFRAVPSELDVGREAVGGEQHPVRFARFRFGQVERAGSGAGSAATSSVSVPIFENSGQFAAQRGADRAQQSGQATLPSAAFGLIEKPCGSVTFAVFSSEGEGVIGLCVCGTLRSASRPEGVSAAAVVGFAVTLGAEAGLVAARSFPATGRLPCRRRRRSIRFRR